MIKIHQNIEQGSDEWFALRCGVLTASEMSLILTPTLKVASNEKERAHVFELAAQRVTGYVEPSYVGEAMMRGHIDEIRARDKYAEENMEIVDEVGFITNDKWGFTLGYSPDGLVGSSGLIECKSRKQKFQIETILNQEVPIEHRLQLQTGLLVTDREWIDYISYCGGMPMCVLRVYPDEEMQKSIIDAATQFEERVSDKIKTYNEMLKDKKFKLYPTEREIEEVDDNMIDISDTIKPKSDQLNADDLLVEPLTIEVTKVNKQSGDQPVAISFKGDDGKPFLPCKSMRRVLIYCWGKDASAYVGRKMTIYRDAKVTWAGAEVGGIRISHVSDIKSKMTLSLTAAKSKKSVYTVFPLGDTQPVTQIDADALLEQGNLAASNGSDELKKWFTSLSNNEKLAIKPKMEELKKLAKTNDNDEGVM